MLTRAVHAPTGICLYAHDKRTDIYINIYIYMDMHEV